MSDYIKREDALKAVDAFIGTDPIAERIKLIPSVDVAPIIRCKDCRWWDKEREQCGITPSSSPYGHCHDGETLEHSMIKDAGR